MAMRFMTIAILALVTLATATDPGNAMSQALCRAQCRLERQCSNRGPEQAAACRASCAVDCEKRATGSTKQQ